MSELNNLIPISYDNPERPVPRQISVRHDTL